MQKRAIPECAAIGREACNEILNESLSGMALDSIPGRDSG